MRIYCGCEVDKTETTLNYFERTKSKFSSVFKGWMTKSLIQKYEDKIGKKMYLITYFEYGDFIVYLLNAFFLVTCIIFFFSKIIFLICFGIVNIALFVMSRNFIYLLLIMSLRKSGYSGKLRRLSSTDIVEACIKNG